jgi:hypothetical protein
MIMTDMQSAGFSHSELEAAAAVVQHMAAQSPARQVHAIWMRVLWAIRLFIICNGIEVCSFNYLSRSYGAFETGPYAMRVL